MTLILCASPGCLSRVPEPLPRKMAVYPVYCAAHQCQCDTWTAFMGIPVIAQRQIIANARAACGRHG